MRKGVFSTTLLGCVLWASFGVAAASETALTLDTDTINERLKGKIVVIELQDGSKVKKAKRLVVEPNFTYWKAKGKEERVATDQIVRISARSKSDGWIGLGIGAGIGVIGIATTTEDSESAALVGDTGPLPSQSYANNISAVIFAGLGYGIDRLMPRRLKLVYDRDSGISRDQVDRSAHKKKRRAV